MFGSSLSCLNTHLTVPVLPFSTLHPPPQIQFAHCSSVQSLLLFKSSSSMCCCQLRPLFSNLFPISLAFKIPNQSTRVDLHYLFCHLLVQIDLFYGAVFFDDFDNLISHFFCDFRGPTTAWSIGQVLIVFRISVSMSVQVLYL